MVTLQSELGMYTYNAEVMSFKQIIKRNVHPLVWERLGQAKQEFSWARQAYHCDSNLIPVFKKYLSKQSGYYVEVGSYDGRGGSNTYHLEMQLGWSGVLVEPIMHLFFRSRQIRNLNKNQFFNAACVSEDYKLPYIELYYSGMMSVVTEDIGKMKSEDWARVGSQFLSRGETVQRAYSNARTLTSILDEAKAPNVIDFLSIDVEGYELSVLNGIDFHRYSFNFILIETSENSPSFELLLKLGYEHLATIAQNVLFRTRNFD